MHFPFEVSATDRCPQPEAYFAYLPPRRLDERVALLRVLDRLGLTLRVLERLLERLGV